MRFAYFFICNSILINPISVITYHRWSCVDTLKSNVYDIIEISFLVVLHNFVSCLLIISINNNHVQFIVLLLIKLYAHLIWKKDVILHAIVFSPFPVKTVKELERKIPIMKFINFVELTFDTLNLSCHEVKIVLIIFFF